MKTWVQRKIGKAQLIPYIEIIIGIILLSIEVYDYFTLYSMTEVDAMYGGIVDFYKYKENLAKIGKIRKNRVSVWLLELFGVVSLYSSGRLNGRI